MKLHPIFFAGLATICTAAYAQTDYPARPVQVIVGYPAGGNVDVMARNLAAAMAEQSESFRAAAERLHQPIVYQGNQMNPKWLRMICAAKLAA